MFDWVVSGPNQARGKPVHKERKPSFVRVSDGAVVRAKDKKRRGAKVPKSWSDFFLWALGTSVVFSRPEQNLCEVGPEWGKSGFVTDSKGAADQLTQRLFHAWGLKLICLVRR